MEWAQVLNDSLLQNLPFKIELNKFGQLLMTPASNKHGRVQFKIGLAITKKKKKGEIISECSINTSDGVKVADIAWASDEFIAQFGYTTPYEKAPELCVEITSPSNSKEEIEHKIELYLAKGAMEVWIVDEDEHLAMYSHTGRINSSRIVDLPKI